MAGLAKASQFVANELVIVGPRGTNDHTIQLGLFRKIQGILDQLLTCRRFAMISLSIGKMNAVFPPLPIREFRDRSDGIPESERRS